MLLFLKLFKILVECVAPAQVYLVLRNYEPQQPTPDRAGTRPTFHTAAMRVVTGLGPPASPSATMRVKSIWKLNVLINTKKLGRKQSRRLFSEDRDLN